MSEPALTCANHPDRETGLRCNRCGKPICSQCALLTPVGYRCKACVHNQQAVFETTHNYDFIIGAVISATSVGIGISILGFLGFWGFLLAPVLGGLTARLVQTVIRHRRSRNLPLVAAIGGVIGLIPHLIAPASGIVVALADPGNLALWGRIAIAAFWPIGYAILIISTLYASLKGIRI